MFMSSKDKEILQGYLHCYSNEYSGCNGCPLFGDDRCENKDQLLLTIVKILLKNEEIKHPNLRR
jgi:hypothetical protein